MKLFSVVIVFVVMIAGLEANARDKGPTLKSVTDKILNIVQEDGRWYPGGDWWAAGLDTGKELKVVIKTSKGKKYAWATFEFRAKASGDFAKITGVKKMWPVDYRNYSKLKKFKVGKYTLDVYFGTEKVWTTDFNVKNDKFDGKNHFYAVGRWTKLAYFSFSKGSTGSRICGWFSPPDVKGWFPSKKNFRGFDFTGDIKKDGKIIVSDSGSANRPFQIDRARTAHICKGISYWREIREKIASKDGQYTANAYASYSINGKSKIWTVMSVNFTVKAGKLVMNEKLTGKKVSSRTRIITSDAVYVENKKSLKSIPPVND
ncbi:MAG: hypothetical protein JXR95_00245 [Deltaproteobacteria bacterium]|nr:hypothetical protein [Deltaproteobacteria bacterium]